MTIEELAEQTVDKLKALSNEDLTKILEPYFPKTRPELVKKARVESKQKELPVYISPAKSKAMALLEEEGIDLSFLKGKKKWKR